MYADTIFSEADLPLRLAGLSHCFRTEAGSHGRESKGLYRVHQFTKVEMFATCRPEDSDALHEEMREVEERVFRDLDHSRVLLDCIAHGADRDQLSPANYDARVRDRMICDAVDQLPAQKDHGLLGCGCRG
jgi:seryl-tRNA synthetase